MATVFELFRHNWLTALQIETSWITDITVSYFTQAEERRGLLGKPFRTITPVWQGLNQEDAHRLLWTLMRLTTQELLIPLYSDQRLTTVFAGNGTFNITMENTDIVRIFPGASIAIYKCDGSGAHFTTITGFLSSFEITVADALPVDYPIGSYVVPLLATELLLEPSMTLQTDRLCSVQVTLKEKPLTALGAVQGFGGLPFLPGIQSQIHPNGETYYILDTSKIQWADNVTLGAVRPGEIIGFGRDDHVEGRGSPVLSFQFTAFFEDSDAFFLMLRFVEAHKGRLHPFWLLNPLTIWNPLALTTTEVDVEGFGDIGDPSDFGRFVGILLKDGTYLIREIASIAPVGDDFRITFGTTIPATALADVEKVTSAHFVRSASDSFKEVWTTDGVGLLEFDLVEVLDEAEYGLIP